MHAESDEVLAILAEGTKLLQSGKASEAAEKFHAAILRDPSSADACHGLGLSYSKMGKTDLACRHLEQAVRLKRNDPHFHYNLGVHYEQTGRAADAIREMQAAIGLNPGYTQAQQRLAQLGAPAGIATPESVAFVKREIENWQAKGLISATLASKLQAEYAPGPKPSSQAAVAPEDQWPKNSLPTNPGMVLLYLGGVLIISGIVVITSKYWPALDKGGQFSLLFFITAGLYGAGAYIHTARPEQRKVAAVLLFFGTLIVPFLVSVGLNLMMPQPIYYDAYQHGMLRQSAAHTRPFTIALITLLIQLATLAIFRNPVLTVTPPITLVTLASLSIDAAIPGYSQAKTSTMMVTVMLTGLGLSFLGGYVSNIGKRTYATVPNLVGSLAALGGVYALSLHTDSGGWLFISILMCLSAIAASVWTRNQIYLIMGAIFLMFNIFYMGFHYFSNTAGMPVTLIVCGILCMAIGYAVNCVRRDYILE